MGDTATVQDVFNVLSEVMDPELGMAITDLGLVYSARVGEDGRVAVDFSLTYPGCPVGDLIQKQIKARVAGLPGVAGVDANLVWNPPWNPSMMSESARLMLGYPI